ncbi:hypothetical protein Barb6XT_00769 [Bacteroidales bacterium Barb6XT]|nr:hypothetical protein Barb6XT_00769 [Bacteroidales bacterium Barb6XT]
MLRQRLQQRSLRPAALAYFRHNTDTARLLLGQLCLHIKRPYRLHLIPKEINPVRKLIRVRKHIKDTPAHGKLPRLIHIIRLLKAVFGQHISHKHAVHLLPHMDLQRIILQRLARHHFLRQRLRTGHNHKPLLRLQQHPKHFRPQYLIRRIRMSVLNRPPISRREEINLRQVRQLHQIMVKIPRLLRITQHAHETIPAPHKKSGCSHRSPRSGQSLHKNILRRLVLQQAAQSLHLRMGSIQVQQFLDFQYQTHVTIGR